MYGREKWICESNPLKRWAYRLVGEIHVPGRVRSYHILNEIRRLGLMNRSIRMLDAGSGKGDLAIHLARRCPQWSIVGLELDPQKIANARRVARHCDLRNIEFCAGRLEELNFERSFDLIVNADVLEHIEDDTRVLRNLCRALRPGGHIVLTSPSIPQRKHLGLVKWRERRIGFHPSQYGHVRDGYSHRDLEEKLRSAGGHLVHSHFTFGFFGTLAFDLFFVIGDNKPNPAVFALMFPFLMVLGALDLWDSPRIGSAILAVGAAGPVTAGPSESG